MALAQGESVAKVARRLGVAEQTDSRWRREYGGLRLDQAKRFKELEQENARLKRAGGRSGAGPRHPQRGGVGKLLSPGAAAAGALAQPRSTQRHPVQVPADEPALIARIIALARRFGRLAPYRRRDVLLRPPRQHRTEQCPAPEVRTGAPQSRLVRHRNTPSTRCAVASPLVDRFRANGLAPVGPAPNANGPTARGRDADSESDAERVVREPEQLRLF